MKYVIKYAQVMKYILLIVVHVTDALDPTKLELDIACIPYVKVAPLARL
jgi:hypothetical protein